MAECMESVLNQVWSDAFGQECPNSENQKGLYAHLMELCKLGECESQGFNATCLDMSKQELSSIVPPLSLNNEDKWHFNAELNNIIRHRLKLEVEAKRRYLDTAWGHHDVALILCQVDGCIIALQQYSKQEFLASLQWKTLPPTVVFVIAKAVLLLFDVKVSNQVCNEVMWQTTWTKWITENIDKHGSGWQWLANNEPLGLFTKPYTLSTSNLSQVELLVNTIKANQSVLPSGWRVYEALGEWVIACTDYVHMITHCLPCFTGFAALQTLTKPPERTADINIWFQLHTPDGNIPYYYNRVLQVVTLELPSDFDGQHVKFISPVIRSLVVEALDRDPTLRKKLYMLNNQKIQEDLHAQDEWIECFDSNLQAPFYYSLRHFKVSLKPPESGIFIPCTKSIAYHAVVKLQASYRRARLERKLKQRFMKRASLPLFPVATTKFC